MLQRNKIKKETVSKFFHPYNWFHVYVRFCLDYIFYVSDTYQIHEHFLIHQNHQVDPMENAITLESVWKIAFSGRYKEAPIPFPVILMETEKAYVTVSLQKRIAVPGDGFYRWNLKIRKERKYQWEIKKKIDFFFHINLSRFRFKSNVQWNWVSIILYAFNLSRIIFKLTNMFLFGGNWTGNEQFSL